MASRLKPVGAGSKLAGPRPMQGSGLKGLSPVGLRRPAAGQSGMKPPSVSPSGLRKVAGVVKPQQGTPGKGPGPSAAPPPSSSTPQQQGAPAGGGSEPPVELEVGDRVLVGGAKAGTIAFVGPTQFSRGVWAGVVLDTKDGKNNGCVNGVQYFECEASRGLFARPEKLSLLAKSSSLAPASSSSSQASRGASQEQDEFMVGDVVMMEGGKQGHVAFFGPTQFARGAWVGVVLDIPEGKNSGRVGEVQYFDCPPNHGLFTRPQKLRLVKRKEAEPAHQDHAPNQSPVMDLKMLREKLKLGDRVLVAGAKEGFLRYLGPTEFSKGVWAGVELEEPLGKNDGAVSGKRYFQCPPRHGLFAPLPKVEKMADSGPPPANSALITSTAGSSPGRVRNNQTKYSPQLSGSSSSSLGAGKPPLTGGTPPSGVQSSPPQSSGLAQLVEEKERLVSELQATLQGREREQREMSERITTLSRTVEDLQFQLEEQGVISGDKLEVVEEGTQLKLAELEGQLAREREDSARLRLQQQSQGEGRGGGGENQSDGDGERVREELMAAQSISSHLSSQLTLAQDKIQKLTTELEGEREGEREKSSNLEAELAQAERTVGELRSEVTGVKQDLHDAMDLCSQHEALMEERNRELDICDTEIRSLKKERESWSDEQVRLVGEQQKLALERDQAIAEANRLLANNSDITGEQSQWSRQRQSLMAERDQLVAERQAQRTEIEKVSRERDSLRESLEELQRQRQDVMGQSREIGAKYDSIQEQLETAQTEVERLRLELMSATSRAEHDRMSLQEQMELVKAGEVEMQRRLGAVVRERDSTLSRAQEMSDKLLDVEKERDSLQEVVVRSSGEINRLQDELDEITRSHRLLEREVESESGALHQRLDVAEETLGQRERDLTEARERITSLSDELVISQGKRDQMMLEEEKELLEERVRELTVQLEQAQSSSSSKSMAAELGEMDAPSQEEWQFMQQSIEDYEQQVEFLNSVISDLQQKLEAVESLQLMETGEIPVSDDEEVAQLPPPRLFCDICDQFDLHDTDDCPLQAASDSPTDSPPPSSYAAPRARGGSDRPYCTNCEVFGHLSEDCEYDVTY